MKPEFKMARFAFCQKGIKFNIGNLDTGLGIYPLTTNEPELEECDLSIPAMGDRNEVDIIVEGIRGCNRCNFPKNCILKS